MIKLTNIHAQITKDIFKTKDRKFLRISVSNTVKRTQKPGTILGPQSIEWNEPIYLPLLYQKQLAFEIYDKHEFGYNPEELSTILEGNIIIKDPEETHGLWAIMTKGNQDIGFLSAKITLKNSQSDSDDEDNEVKTLKIKSIVAHATDFKEQKGFVSIKIGQNIINTKPIKNKRGELIFVDIYHIDKQPKIKEGKISILEMNTLLQSKVIGEGTFQLDENKVPRKILLNKNNKKVGEIFMESKLIKKEGKKETNKIENKSSLTIQEESVKPRRRRNSPQTIDYSRLQHFGISSSRNAKPVLDSRVSQISRNKTSLLTGNNGIFFGKEKRFQKYQDKQTDRITYLEDRGFQFKDRVTKKYYRGASIGKGDKSDFVKGSEVNPGVGRYQLPSIWDRY